MKTKPVRHVRAGQLPPTELPTHAENYLQSIPLRRIEADQLQPGGIYFSDPPEHVSTDETRKVRASFFRRVVLPTAIVTASVLAALVMAFLPTT